MQSSCHWCKYEDTCTKHVASKTEEKSWLSYRQENCLTSRREMKPYWKRRMARAGKWTISLKPLRQDSWFWGNLLMYFILYACWLLACLDILQEFGLKFLFLSITHSHLSWHYSQKNWRIFCELIFSESCLQTCNLRHLLHSGWGKVFL